MFTEVLLARVDRKRPSSSLRAHNRRGNHGDGAAPEREATGFLGATSSGTARYELISKIRETLRSRVTRRRRAGPA